MKTLSRVVWAEGMHLAQHHFQAQSRYFEDTLGFVLRGLFFEPYGLAGLELEAEALLNGTVSVTHARGIMPDGLAFDFPADPLPEPLEIRSLFSPTHDSHLVLLGIPPHRPGRSNCALDGNGGPTDARYSAVTRELSDETTGLHTRPVGLARKNFRLLLDAQPGDELVLLPIARVRRDGSGRFVYDPDYVPPCLRIAASLRLTRLLSRLVELLDAKADALAAERRVAHASLAEYASREIAGFWLSHTIHSALPPLRHLLHTRSCHPERLFSELSQLAGALCTFSLESDPRELPRYEHERLDVCFAALERHIREHLEVVMPTSCARIRLRQADPEQLAASSSLSPQALEPYRELFARASQSFHLGAVTDRRCLGKSSWFLGVRSRASQGEIVARVPSLIKVCSGRFIARLVKEAYPGLPLEHVASPPAELSPSIDTQYFRIRTDGPCWTSLLESEEVGIYVPAAIPEAELELAVVLGS